MKQLIDVIVHVPQGFTLAIQELIAHGKSQYLTWNHQTGQPNGIGIGGLHRFYPGNPAGDDPMLAYLRMDQQVFDDLFAINWLTVDILITCPAGGISQQTGSAPDDLPIYTTSTIYDLLAAYSAALEIYNSLQTPYPEYQTDIDGNILYDPDPESGEPVPRNHPQAGQLRPLVAFRRRLR